MENNMSMDRDLKRLIHVSVKCVDTASLQALGQMLKKPQRMSLERRYGKILRLLEVDVQEEAITALAQYYDHPLRCFTFQDFQLAPALEEFEQILGLPLSNTQPYQYLGHYPSLKIMASLLRIPPRDLEAAQQNRNGIKGFTREFLEGHLQLLMQSQDWEGVIDVLALIIYGLVLFPSINNYIDYAAIDVFHALRNKSENPVTALLADVYGSMHYCHTRKGKRIICCLPVLFVWLTSHIFQRPYKDECPIADFRMYQLSAKSRNEWATYLADLGERQIRWYPKWKEIGKIICSCGDYNNVPLMGTKGCINYNPALAQRQLGYPILAPPSPNLVDPFDFYYTDEGSEQRLKEVPSAWERVVLKGRELGVRSCDAKDSYRRWLQERVQTNKLPFKRSLPVEEPSMIDEEGEQIKEWRAQLEEARRGKRKIDDELLEAQQMIAELKRENAEKDQAMGRLKNKIEVDEKHFRRVQRDLGAAAEELKRRDQERDEAHARNNQLKEMITKAKMAQREAALREEAKQKQIEELSQQMQQLNADHEEAIQMQTEELRQQIQQLISNHEEATTRTSRDTGKVIQSLEEQIKRLEGQVQRVKDYAEREEKISEQWHGRFAQMAWMSNNAIADIPHMLRRAEAATNPLNTPAAVRDFLDYCKSYLERMKYVAARRG